MINEFATLDAQSPIATLAQVSPLEDAAAAQIEESNQVADLPQESANDEMWKLFREVHAEVDSILAKKNSWEETFSNRYRAEEMA